MILPSLLVIDDFIADPMAARNAALSLNYDPDNKNGNYPGHISTKPLEVQGLNERIGNIINAPVKAAENTSHMHCRVTLRGDKGRSGVHIDPAFYSGILYLSLPENCRGGTEFFRHKRTGLERVPTDPLAIGKAGYGDINALIEDVVNKDTNHPAKWTKVMTVPMRFNRLILFSPWMFHNSGLAFGKTPQDGRLVQLMFFAKA